MNKSTSCQCASEMLPSIMTNPVDWPGRAHPDTAMLKPDCAEACRGSGRPEVDRPRSPDKLIIA